MGKSRQKSARTARDWDCAKLVANVLSSASDSENCVFVVLVLSGALNPIHRGHTEMLRHSKRLLEAGSSGREVVVVGFALAPSSEDYVNEKLGDLGMSLRERILLCEAAACSDRETCVVPFGIASGYRTIAEMRPCLEQQLHMAAVQVHLEILPVYGSDFLVKRPQNVRQATLIVCRQDEEDSAQIARQIVAAEPRPHPGFQLLEVEAGLIPNYSSTGVRKACDVIRQDARPEAVLEAWDYLKRSLHPKVLELFFPAGKELPEAS
ncbi:TY5A [Symbiodinium microadriaticum]|nr:TY5A [Symbiodinium microadriaticum]